MQKKSEPDDLVYKTRVQTEQPTMVPAEVDGLLSDAAVAEIGDVIGELTNGHEKKIADLQTQVAELRGQVTALLSLLQGKAANVVVLPKKSHA